MTERRVTRMNRKLRFRSEEPMPRLGPFARTARFRKLLIARRKTPADGICARAKIELPILHKLRHIQQEGYTIGGDGNGFKIQPGGGFSVDKHASPANLQSKLAMGIGASKELFFRLRLTGEDGQYNRHRWQKCFIHVQLPVLALPGTGLRAMTPVTLYAAASPYPTQFAERMHKDQRGGGGNNREPASFTPGGLAPAWRVRR